MTNYESIPELLKKKNLGIDVEGELRERKNCVVKTGLKGINMEEIVYTSTGILNSKLNTLTNLFNKVLNTSRVISKDSVLLEGYYSATIEGARTTIDYVKSCFSNPKGKSEKMIVNTYNALGYVRDKDISYENVLLKAWSIIVDGVCENINCLGDKYRSKMVYVSNGIRVIYTPPSPEKLQDYMNLLFDYTRGSSSTFQECLLKAVISHFYLVYVHPMCDGNGRLARLLMLSLLSRDGYSKVLNLLVSESINERLSGYYMSLLLPEQSLSLDGVKVLDVTPFIIYMLDVFERSLVMYSIFKESSLTPNESKVISKMKGRGIHSEITVVKCSKILKISESTSRNVLNSLAEKNILGKKRIGRKCIYWLL